MYGQLDAAQRERAESGVTTSYQHQVSDTSPLVEADQVSGK
jgi:hypothetical protein